MKCVQKREERGVGGIWSVPGTNFLARWSEGVGKGCLTTVLKRGKKWEPLWNIVLAGAVCRNEERKA